MAQLLEFPVLHSHISLSNFSSSLRTTLQSIFLFPIVAGVTEHEQLVDFCHPKARIAEDTTSFAWLSYLSLFRKLVCISDPPAMLNLQGFLNPLACVCLSFPVCDVWVSASTLFLPTPPTPISLLKGRSGQLGLSSRRSQRWRGQGKIHGHKSQRDGMGFVGKISFGCIKQSAQGSPFQLVKLKKKSPLRSPMGNQRLPPPWRNFPVLTGTA